MLWPLAGEDRKDRQGGWLAAQLPLASSTLPPLEDPYSQTGVTGVKK